MTDEEMVWEHERMLRDSTDMHLVMAALRILMGRIHRHERGPATDALYKVMSQRLEVYFPEEYGLF